jgi:hypothetical protein
MLLFPVAAALVREPFDFLRSFTVFFQTHQQHRSSAEISSIKKHWLGASSLSISAFRYAFFNFVVDDPWNVQLWYCSLIFDHISILRTPQKKFVEVNQLRSNSSLAIKMQQNQVGNSSKSFSFRSNEDEDSYKPPTPSIEKFAIYIDLYRQQAAPLQPTRYHEHDDDRHTVGQAPEGSHQGARAGGQVKREKKSILGQAPWR